MAMSEWNVRAGDSDSSYGTFSTLEAAERALRMVQRHDPEARIVVKHDWRARALMAEAQVRRVREVCDLWQRRHDSAIRHLTDIPAIAIIAVLRALEGDVDE